MTVEEASKVNELYKQIDSLTAENKLLREEVISRFDGLELLVKDIACKCDVKKSNSMQRNYSIGWMQKCNAAEQNR